MDQKKPTNVSKPPQSEEESSTEATNQLRPTRSRKAVARPQRNLQKAHFDSYHLAQDYLQRAVGHLNAKRYSEAISDFKIALQHNRESAEAHFYLGLAYFMISDYQQAKSAYQEAVVCEPGDATIHENLGIVYQLLNQHSEAAQAFTHAIALDPNQAESYSRLGSSLLQLGKRDEAKAAYCQAFLVKLQK
ncbi:MAG: tetratricopeptide repeat protein [Candidatus Poribacteria bacterium]|jgi:tetratricopeptide (TPR) repeat protein|nr:tetratricopeptide repeat protein [Candidatus Poribacteria bacterium]MDP6746934.1 tetratricopeptide repeat protein [Candidatus Poribacteria bacterium]MDP6994831.1 tetratricopeptide repeat protein [Candidatus Poribacteria bacterium]